MITVVLPLSAFVMVSLLSFIFCCMCFSVLWSVLCGCVVICLCIFVIMSAAACLACVCWSVGSLSIPNSVSTMSCSRSLILFEGRLCFSPLSSKFVSYVVNCVSVKFIVRG